MTGKRPAVSSILKVWMLVLPLYLPAGLYGQANYDALLDSLKLVREMPYICESEGSGCGDSLFWRVIQYKLDIVPALIDRMADTTATEANVVLFGGSWTVADIAYVALGEVIHDIPTFKLLGIRFDRKDCGYCAYWNHVRENFDNRRRFQKRVGEWYASNRRKLVWAPGNDYQICDCGGMIHPNGGHFELKKRNKALPAPGKNK